MIQAAKIIHTYSLPEIAVTFGTLLFCLITVSILAGIYYVLSEDKPQVITWGISKGKSKDKTEYEPSTYQPKPRPVVLTYGGKTGDPARKADMNDKKWK